MSNPSPWVPEWAARAVWYQIFPERFRNGNQNANPTINDIAGAWPDAPDEPWELHPWTSDWYELQPYERANGNGIWWNLIRRRYGGDLQGIIDKLDYLQDLGITAIYLNPVFESPSHHKYDGMLYHHVDRTLGPDPTGDREIMASENPADPATWHWTAADRLALRLISEVHRRGMRIIFDGVFNHVSVRSPFFQDVMRNQRGSKYADWFSIDSWEDPSAGARFAYTGWFGVPELPEWRQDENGIVPGPREYIFEITRRWMAPHGDPAEGVDGWRLDVAFCIAHPFWKAWRRHVKSINPEAYLTAEVVEPVPEIEPYLQGDEFDAVMNYNVGFACAEYFLNRAKRIRTSEFDRLLRELRAPFDPAVPYVQQNYFDSHDSARMATNIMNPDGEPYRNWPTYHGFSKVENNPAYVTRRPTETEYEIQKLIVLFMMTYVGAPVVYYGDEVGMWGANDPCCRKPMVWDDLAHDPEATGPDGRQQDPPDPVGVNHEVFATYRRLIHLRHSYPALSVGDFTTVLTDDDSEVYAFRRRHRGQEIVVVINNADRSREVALRIGEHTQNADVSDVLNGGRYRATGGALTLTARPRWGAVLVRLPEES